MVFIHGQIPKHGTDSFWMVCAIFVHWWLLMGMGHWMVFVDRQWAGHAMDSNRLGFCFVIVLLLFVFVLVNCEF